MAYSHPEGVRENSLGVHPQVGRQNIYERPEGARLVLNSSARRCGAPSGRMEDLPGVTWG